MPSDYMTSKNNISSMRGPSFVSGNERLGSLLTISSCTDSFEFRQKRIQNGINKRSGAIENVVKNDLFFVSDDGIPGKSCSDSYILEKRSRELSLKQDNFAYKRRKMRHSVALLSGHAQTAFFRECVQNGPSSPNGRARQEKIENLVKTKVNLKRRDKNLTTVLETLCLDKARVNLETNFNDKGYDKRPNVDCGMSDIQKAGEFLENEVICKWHDKSCISATQMTGHRLQSRNKTQNGGLNMDLYRNCFENTADYNLFKIKNISRSQSVSSLLSDSDGKVKNPGTSVEVACRNMSGGNFKKLSTPGDFSPGESTYKLRGVVNNTQYEIPVAGAFGSSAPEDSTVAAERELEREWCISILEESNLLQFSSGIVTAVEHPGFVGYGNTRCKICDSLEDSTSTLICDICEESFHMSCCNPRVVSIPKDDWYCTACRRKRKKLVINPCIGSRENVGGLNLKFRSCLPGKGVREKSTGEKGDIFRHMLQDSVDYTTQVRIGKNYQADIPIWTGEVMDYAEFLFMGELVSLEEKLFQLDLAEHNLKDCTWSKGWKPARCLPPGSKENWLQCRNILYSEGEICPYGRKAKKDIICGKWRRAPLGEVQNDEWECSCAVVWDPAHADCAVPQEVPTVDVLKRLKASEPI